MARNIYDDPGFFAGYSRLPRSTQGLDGAAEWQAMRALLPDMQGLRVVDLGCGFGWFCRWACAHGAAEVLGLDVSKNMLERARGFPCGPALRYAHADLETLSLPAESFDLAYSSLALHYLADLGRLLGVVHAALCAGGHFVFSIEHPIYMAPTGPRFVTDATGHRHWPLDGYLREGPRVTDWLAPGVVKHHRTIGTTLTALLRAGFAITHVEEWGPTDAQIAAHPDWAEARERPMFLLVATQR